MCSLFNLKMRPPWPSTLRIHPPSLFSFLLVLVDWDLPFLWGAVSPFLSGQHTPPGLCCYLTLVISPIFSRGGGNISCIEASALLASTEWAPALPREEGALLQVWEVPSCLGESESLGASAWMPPFHMSGFPIFPAWSLVLVSQVWVRGHLNCSAVQSLLC